MKYNQENMLIRVLIFMAFSISLFQPSVKNIKFFCDFKDLKQIKQYEVAVDLLEVWLGVQTPGQTSVTE